MKSVDRARAILVFSLFSSLIGCAANEPAKAPPTPSAPLPQPEAKAETESPPEAPPAPPPPPSPPKEGDIVYPGGATGRDARGTWRKGGTDPWAKGEFIAHESCPSGDVIHKLVLNGSEASVSHGSSKTEGHLEFGTSTSGLPARARFVLAESLLGYLGGEDDFAVLDGPNVGFSCHEIPEMVFVRVDKESSLKLTSFVHPKGFRFVYPAAFTKATAEGDVAKVQGAFGGGTIRLSVKRVPGIVRAVRPPPPDTERTPPEEIDQAVRYSDARGFRVGGTKSRTGGTDFRQVLTLPFGAGLVEAVCEVDGSKANNRAPHEVCRLMLQSIELR